jgi:hypothetical protein
MFQPSYVALRITKQPHKTRTAAPKTSEELLKRLNGLIHLLLLVLPSATIKSSSDIISNDIWYTAS